MKSKFIDVAKELCNKLGYRLIDYKAKGVFKETFHVKTSTDEELALKIADPEKVTKRTIREIEAMQRCDSPYICKLHDFNDFKSKAGKEFFYSVEEYLGGGTLAEKIRVGDITSKNALKFAISISEGIKHLWEYSLVHRDLKPDNIMFRVKEETPVIVDFGLVRNLLEYSLTPSAFPQGPGTPLYSSPEQLNNEKEIIDWRSDQFSLGIIIGEIFTGKHPFQIRNTTNREIVERIQSRSGISPEFKEDMQNRDVEGILKMLEPWPIHRYNTPDLLIEQLKTL